jgi:hypothetical protein
MTATEQTDVAKTKQKTQKKFYKKWWFWAIIIILAIAFAPKDSSENAAKSSDTKSTTATAIQTPDATQAKPQEEPKVQEPAVPAEYKSALAKATSYANTMHMSKQGVYNQLTSEYGEKFAPEAAQYAIDNVKADWNANALAKAKDYQDSMHMSPAAIHDQLTSEYGEKFTQAEADYAIQHLNG